MAFGEIVGKAVASNTGIPAEIVFLTANGTRRAPYREGDTVLDTAKLAGIPLPSQCRLGGCATCRVKILKGQVMMRRNNILSPNEIEQGQALACQSLPQSVDVEIQLL